MAKQVMSYQTDDGKNWDSMEEAVAHELDLFFHSLAGEDGLANTRLLGIQLVEPQHRQSLSKILSQLG